MLHIKLQQLLHHAICVAWCESANWRCTSCRLMSYGKPLCVSRCPKRSMQTSFVGRGMRGWCLRYCVQLCVCVRTFCVLTLVCIQTMPSPYNHFLVRARCAQYATACSKHRQPTVTARAHRMLDVSAFPLLITAVPGLAS